MCWERSPSETNDAAVSYCFNEFCMIRNVRNLNFLAHFLFLVCLDYNQSFHSAHASTGLNDIRNRSGNTGVYRCADKSIGVTDSLSDFYVVTLCNERFTRSTDALRHADFYNIRNRHNHGLEIRGVLVVRYQNAR